ncbi:MAG: glycosyl transferase family 28 [Sphingobacteriia bacterium]|nr:MAG: glycosyl transferase family 28 [Sphingobacteriia bacterium]
MKQTLLNDFNITRVLVAPLDWGLGHATRCIPIVRALLYQGYEVVLAAEGKTAALLQKEFPQVSFVELKGYRIRYSQKDDFLMTLARQLPKVLQTMRQEHKWLMSLAVEEKIDLVISDNRYGLWHPHIPCIFMTHQLQVRTPYRFLNGWVRWIHYRFIEKFDACWVPDVKAWPGLAASLSHPRWLPNLPVSYIKLLSRFVPNHLPIKFTCCALLSGPEPQRTILESMLVEAFSEITDPILLIRGLPEGGPALDVPANVTVVDHYTNDLLGYAIQRSEYIVCRSGYTSVMELLSLRKKMILVPTPGQTEQEYLALQLMRQELALSFPQKGFCLTAALAAAKNHAFATVDLPVFEEKQLPDLIAQSLQKSLT